MRSPVRHATVLITGFLLSAGLGAVCVRHFRPPPGTSDTAVSPQERILPADSMAGTDDVDRRLLENVLQGLMDGRSPAEIADLLKDALHRRPREVMAMVFHQLSVQDSLALLPLLAPELAKLPDSVIQTALAEVRTSSELRLAWREVTRCRIEQDMQSGLKLALSAPHGADMESSFAALCVNAGGSEVLAKLLSSGLPVEWAISGVKDANVEHGMDLIRQLDQYKKGKWTAGEYYKLLCKLPDSASDRAEIIRFLAATPAWRRSMDAAHLSALAGNFADLPADRQEEFIAALPEEFARGLVAQRIRKTVADRQQFANIADPKQDGAASPTETAESVSAARSQIQSSAEIRVAMSGEDEGKQALAWARAQGDEDVRSAAVESVMQALSNMRGPVGPVLAFDAETLKSEPILFADAVDQVVQAVGAREFNSQELARLANLPPPVIATLREKLSAAGRSGLAAQLQ